MNSTSNKGIELFTVSGCLTAEALELLSYDSLEGDQKALAMAHIADCEFCKDALEGIDRRISIEQLLTDTTVRDNTVDILYSHKPIRRIKLHKPITLVERTEKLNERIRSRSEYHKEVAAAKRGRGIRKPYFGLVTVAASIILFLGIYFVVRQRPELKDKQVAMEKNQTEIHPESPIADSVQAVDSRSEKTNKIAADQPSKSGNQQLQLAAKTTSERSFLDESAIQPVQQKKLLSKDVPLIISDSDNADLPVVAEEEAVAGVVANKTEMNQDESKGNAAASREVLEYKAPFAAVEEQPVYPGGETKMKEFIAQNLQYPKKAQENGIEGTVYVNFSVDNTGKIANVKVLRGIGGGCDEEAIRIIQMMPKWIPATLNGKTVSTVFTIPILFRLK